MGTTHNFDQPAASTLGDTDTYPSINGTTSRGAYVTGAQLRSYMGSGLVDVTAATVTITAASHANRTVTLTRAAGIAVTLPAATGTGNRYRFILGAAVTSNTTTIKVADATDIMYGNIIANSTGDTPDLAQPWPTAADSDTVTLNGTTTGGVAIGDFVELVDIATNAWAVYGVVTASGTEATPFSATVS